MKRKPLTHEQHLELAAKIKEAMRLLTEAGDVCRDAFGHSHRATKALFKIRDLITIRSALDDEYHKVTSNEQFQIARHAYYE